MSWGNAEERMSQGDRQVFNALREYKSTDDPFVWVPTNDLWETYLNRADCLPLVRYRLFGKVVRSMFPDAARVQRRVRGKLVYGFSGLSGPMSVRSPR